MRGRNAGLQSLVGLQRRAAVAHRSTELNERRAGPAHAGLGEEALAHLQFGSGFLRCEEEGSCIRILGAVAAVETLIPRSSATCAIRLTSSSYQPRAACPLFAGRSERRTKARSQVSSRPWLTLRVVSSCSRGRGC